MTEIRDPSCARVFPLHVNISAKHRRSSTIGSWDIGQIVNMRTRRFEKCDRNFPQYNLLSEVFGSHGDMGSINRLSFDGTR